MAFPASDVYTMARALLNDQSAQIFTDDVLQPYLNIAGRDLSSLLARANVPVTNSDSAVITLVAEDDELAPGDVDFPEDLIEIQAIYQRQNSNEGWSLITRVEFITPWEIEQLTSYIPVWAYMEQEIRFIPANVELQIKIDYIKNKIPEITAPEDEIDVIDALNYLGYRTSALASMYVGENETRALSLNVQATEEWNQLEGISTKGRQSISTRRRPFRTRNWGGTRFGY